MRTRLYVQGAAARPGACLPTACSLHHRSVLGQQCTTLQQMRSFLFLFPQQAQLLILGDPEQGEAPKVAALAELQVLVEPIDKANGEPLQGFEG